MTSVNPLIVLHDSDNVAVTRSAIDAGETALPGLVQNMPVPRGHKIALKPIAVGEPVIKYGQVIAHATAPIAVGDHVHTQNAGMLDLVLEHQFPTETTPVEMVPKSRRAKFQGYVRADGRVGTRNYVSILSSVNCSATVSRAVARYFNEQGGLDDFDNVDGVVALTHGGGCAINPNAEGYRYLTRTLSGYARNPNTGAALIIGLGCETNHIPTMMKNEGLETSSLLRPMTIQGEGGTRKTIDHAKGAIREMLEEMRDQKRIEVDASALVIALECGGFDGYSGISANPALGHAADLLVRQGGTVCLAETPEIYGGEHLLTSRAASVSVARKLLDRIDWWRDYAERNNAAMDNNPSHGNKEGGLTTILEKSLGAIAKSGTTPLNEVYEYAERIDTPGFVFMDTPGYDPMAVTGQVAGGCNLVCFTTGRGSTAGYKPVPSIKLATNTPMYERMAEDMDIDCGGIVTGSETIEEAGTRIFELILATASGAATKSEIEDYGDNEFVPWQVGAVM